MFAYFTIESTVCHQIATYAKLTCAKLKQRIK